MFDLRWKSMRVVPTLSAQREMLEKDIDMYDAVEVLENGFDCARSRRKAGTYERCTEKGGKILKIVAVSADLIYPDGDIEKVLKITHVGTTTRRRRSK